MDDTQQLLEEVKKLLAVTPKPDQAKSLEEVRRWSDSLPPSVNTSSAKPFVTDPGQLTEPSIYKQFEDLVREFIATDNEGQAIKARRLLEDFLLPKNPSLKATQPELYERYSKIVALLKFISLPTRSLNETDNLVQNYLILAMTWGINIKDKMDEVLFAYDDILNDAEISFRLGRDMLASKELLGGTLIRMEGANKDPKPTVGNWIRDYLSFNVSGGNNIRDAFKRISYLRQSKKILQLNAEDKHILSEIIKVYDWLEFGIYEDDDDGQAQNGALTKGNFTNQQKFSLPDSVLQQNQAVDKPQPPVAPAPKNAPTLKPIEEIRSRLAAFTPPQSRPAPASPGLGGQVQQNLPAKQAVAPSARVNPPSKLPTTPPVLPNKIQPGLSMSIPKDYQMTKNSSPGQKTQADPSRSRAAEVEIDRKLEELEKRIGGKTIDD